MALNMEDILKKLGWDDGFQIPISNAENRALEEELAKLTLKKSKAKNNAERVTGRLDALKEHFKYVSQENEQNQKLITAHKQQLESVDHQFRLGKAEKDSIEHDIKLTTKQLSELEERQSVQKADLQKSVGKAETLKAETDWDTEALKAWEESLKKRDDDNELIKKFSKEDDRKYHELETKRSLLQTDCANKKNCVAKLVTELSNCEMVLERTGKVIKQQMFERDALVSRWKESVKMLQQRDNDIVRAQDAIAHLLELTEKKQEKLEEENEFLKIEEKNNHEIVLDIQELNVVNSRLRRDYNELTQNLLLLNSELQTLKHEMSASAQNLENQRIKSKHIEETIKNKEMLCEKYHEEVENMQEKLQQMQGSNMSGAERIKNIEKLIEAEERQYNIFLADTEKLNNVLFRTDRLLKEQRDIGKSLEVDINNTTCNCNQLRKHIRTEKKNLDKIKEIVYDMEFRIDDFEQKLCKLESDNKQDDHSDEIESKIQELEEILAEHKEIQHTLQGQVDRLQEEMRKLSNFIHIDKEQMEALQNKCENFLLVYEIGKKQIAAAKQSTQEKQVEENIMRLRINQIEKDMKKEEKHIFSLEKVRLNLDQAMRERQIEINMNQTILQAKRRNLDEDRGRLKADIAVRRIKIEQIQRKYHIAIMSLGKDDDGQPISVSHFKIKAAQEKFLLQQEGDELDTKIKTAEKEIVAMENTLKLVNLTNSAFKNSLSPVKDDDQEVQEMKELEDQLRETNNTLKNYRKALAAKKMELEELESRLKEIEIDKEKTQEVINNLEEEIRTIQHQEFKKAEKLKRAECLLNKVLKKLSSMDISMYNRDFEIRQLRDANKSVLQSLVDLSKNYPDMTALIDQCALEQNIQLPDKKYPPSTSSNSTFSTLKSCSSKEVTSSRSSTASQPSSEGSINKIDLFLKL